MASLSANGSANGTQRRIVRFGVFEFDARTGELRKHGVKIRLQGKPLQLLHTLLERPGDVVTREELQQKLWLSDVFVDFDNGLNTAANRLRAALGDSAEHPRYIETLTRAGYRFIAPVEVVTHTGTADHSPAATQSPARSSAKLWMAIAAAAIAVATVGSMWIVAGRSSDDNELQLRQITFRRGQVSGARFAPDGQGILYTANWDNGPRRLYLTSPLSPESRPLGFDELRLVSVSRAGELALMSIDGTMPIAGGALSRVRMNGGVPSPVERNVMSADWSPDGRLAIVHAIDGSNQLEFPVGTVIHKTSGWISGVRMAPGGDRIAFVEHPVRHDNRGKVKLIGMDRLVQTLTGEWANVGGVAWHPITNEIWFTASRDEGAPKSLRAVNTSGQLRSIVAAAGMMTLRDIASNGRVLASRDNTRLEMAAIKEGESTETSLSWLDWSRVADISPDGRLVLFDESGVGGGSQYSVYFRRLDDGSTARLGDGLGMALSPDGTSVLTLNPRDRGRLRMLPLDAGKPADIGAGGLEYQWARYFSDGKRLLALANLPGEPLRLFVQPLDGAKPFAITPPMTLRNVAISPDGKNVILLTPDGKLVLYPTIENDSGRIVSTKEPLAPLLWADDDWLFVQHVGAYTQIPTRVSRFNLTTGELVPWRELQPRDPIGVNAITKVMVSADTRTVIFNYRRVLSELFVLEPTRVRRHPNSFLANDFRR